MTNTTNLTTKEWAEDLALFIENEEAYQPAWVQACANAITQGVKAFQELTRDGAGEYQKRFKNHEMSEKAVLDLAACLLYESAYEYIEELAEA